MPSAMSRPMQPVGTTGTSELGSLPSASSRMIEPLPNCFSMVARARSMAAVRLSCADGMTGTALDMGVLLRTDSEVGGENLARSRGGLVVRPGQGGELVELVDLVEDQLESPRGRGVADRVAVAVQAQALVDRPSLGGDGDVDGADGLGLAAAAGSGDARGRDTD